MLKQSSHNVGVGEGNSNIDSGELSVTLATKAAELVTLQAQYDEAKNDAMAAIGLFSEAKEMVQAWGDEFFERNNRKPSKRERNEQAGDIVEVYKAAQTDAKVKRAALEEVKEALDNLEAEVESLRSLIQDQNTSPPLKSIVQESSESSVGVTSSSMQYNGEIENVEFAKDDTSGLSDGNIDNDFITPRQEELSSSMMSGDLLLKLFTIKDVLFCTKYIFNVRSCEWRSDAK